jgi:hypothetical protein
VERFFPTIASHYLFLLAADLNGFIFQAHCVNFEIKKTNCNYMVCFSKEFVLIGRKNKQVTSAKKN